MSKQTCSPTVLYMMLSGDVKEGISMYLNMNHNDKEAAGWIMISTGEVVSVSPPSTVFDTRAPLSDSCLL